jgi:hypothetical protein
MQGVGVEKSESANVVRIGVDRPAFCVERDTHLDILPHQPLQHRSHLCHYSVNIQTAWFEDLLAAEGQQLPGQSFGAFPSFVDLFQSREIPEPAKSSGANAG